MKLLLPLLPSALAGSLRFPAGDADYGYYYPTAYYDQGSTTDWGCGGTTYSGHRGSDFGVGSWSGMDAGREIVAAAAGVVESTNDGEYDECSTGDCSGGGGYGNYVKIQHADGSATIYAHMKQWTVAVSAGQSVACGQYLGEVGSSGYSTGPHLHFEVRDSAGNRVDPFEGSCSGSTSWWVDQGSYGGLPAPTCVDVPECSPVQALTCGDTVTSRNDGAGSTATHGYYGCSTYAYSGPEVAYEVRTSLSEAVTVSLGGLSADLDLYVLQDASCDASGCIGSSVNPDASGEAVGFDAAAGQAYVVVIDGYEGAVSDFSLTVSCTGAWEEPGDGGATDGGAPDGGADTGATGDGGSMGSHPEDPPPGDPPGVKNPLDGMPAGCATAPAAGLLALAGPLLALRRRQPPKRKVRATA